MAPGKGECPGNEAESVGARGAREIKRRQCFGGNEKVRIFVARNEDVLLKVDSRRQ